jgi:hypothetical protein
VADASHRSQRISAASAPLYLGFLAGSSSYALTYGRNPS